MLSILDLTKTNKLVLAAFVFLAILIFGSGRAHAATLNVATGADETTTNSSCSLSEAIKNINDQAATHPDCLAGNASNDTIQIPAGTITLTTDLLQLTERVTIRGAGMGSTTINGDDNRAFSVFSGDMVIRDLKILGAGNGSAIQSSQAGLSLLNVEIDGTGSLTGEGIYVNITTGVKDVTLNNVYVHSYDGNSNPMAVAQIIAGANATINADVRNVTIADIHVTGAGNFLIGFFTVYSGGGTGSINSTIANVTIDDFTGDDFVAAFGAFGQANSGFDSSIVTNVQNVTITGLRGATGTGQFDGDNSGAFYAGAASVDPGDVVNVTVNVSNSLFADNLSDGVSSNCVEANLSSLFGGDESDAHSTIVSLGHNISDDDTCTSFNEEGDQQNVGNIISTLGPLQNNGGDVPTRALLAGSPAISAGSSVLGIATDARGVARPNSCPSVGAFQFEGAVCGASTPSASGGSNAGAPNTGVGSVAQILNVLASMLGIGLLTYVFRKQQLSS